MSDRISVIIPVYNGERFLSAALQSVLEQTQLPDEIVLVDDGSTDRSPEIIASWQAVASVRIRYHLQINQGPAAARNTGLQLAENELITFLDADDIWEYNTLSVQLSQLTADPEKLITWGKVQQFEMQGTARIQLGQPWHAPNLGSALFRRQAFDVVGSFDEGMRCSEDLDWYFRARDLHVRQSIHNDVVLWYRRHDNNLWLGQPGSFNTSLLALKKRLDRQRTGRQDI